jgi:hypothetical protein
MLQRNKVVRGPQVGKFVMQFLDWKALTNTSDKGADIILKLFTRKYIKCRHFLPTSWKLIHRLSSPRDARTMQRIMCQCNKYYWLPLPQEAVPLTPQEAAVAAGALYPNSARKRKTFCNLYSCPKCNIPRYMQDSYQKLSDTGVVYYYWGVQEAVRELFSHE